MKATTKQRLSVAAAALGIAATAGMTSAFAQEDPTVDSVDMRAEHEAYMEELQTAIENDDFDGWVELKNEKQVEMRSHFEEKMTKMDEMETEEHFNHIKEVKALRDAGDMAGARELQQQYVEDHGIEKNGGMHKGGKKGMHGKRGNGDGAGHRPF